MCDKPHRGTAFYRHRATGFETIQKAREEEYWSHVNPILEAEKYDSIYLDGSNDDYEKIGEFELKFNRLVIYPSQILHSSLINPAALTGNVAAGRLTLRTFVAY